MDFSLSFEQQALVESLTEFVEKELYPHEDVVERERMVPKEIADDIKRKAEETKRLGITVQ